MSDEITNTVAVMPKAEIVPVGNELEVTAATPTQLAECQHSLIDWMRNKIGSVALEVSAAEAEAVELKAAFDYAAKQKWKKDTLAKHHALAVKRVEMKKKRLEYYDKLLAALEAGYYIVPPLKMELFAIRTDRSKPRPMVKILHYAQQGNFQQEPENLPAGQGEYQNPHPKVEHDWQRLNQDDKSVKYVWKAKDWEDIDFPFNMAKPRIMEATTRAMALKVFDELGVLPQDYRRNPDPVIIGRIYDPRPAYYGNRKAITFMLAWHLNTKDL